MLVTFPQQATHRSVSGAKRLSIFGSTGSIGQSAVRLVERFPDALKADVLTGHRNAALLAAQVTSVKPEVAVLSSPCPGPDLELLRAACATEGVKLLLGEQGLLDERVVGADVDTVLAAVVGVAGLRPVCAVLERGRVVALANKESVVAGTTFLRERLDRFGGAIIPVDSEHSALYQLLLGVPLRDVSSLTITASGGPFLRRPVESFSEITPAEAVRHPRWSMGAKISIDSATLMNKALELIEAAYLFGFKEEQVQVIVHPQSIVHGLMTLRCGAVIAHLSSTDMTGPIGFALSHPDARLCNATEPLRFEQLGSLEFEPLDSQKFPAVSLARAALRAGGNHTALFTIANEVAVERFTKGELLFPEIVPLVERLLGVMGSSRDLESLDELEALQTQVTAEA